MAGFREHVSVSGLLGVGYGAAATLAMGFTPEQGALAGCLTWFGGMLPDLDSQSGRPTREIFGVTAALAPLVLVNRLAVLTGNYDRAVLAAIGIYLIVRYGGSWVLGKLSVHRGMFHSIPALLIAAEFAYLGYQSDAQSVRLLMASAVGLGFLSHLVLDEVYSVELSGLRIKLNKAAGSALKFASRSIVATLFTYSLLATLTYGTCIELGLIETPQGNPAEEVLQHAEAPVDTQRF